LPSRYTPASVNKLDMSSTSFLPVMISPIGSEKEARSWMTVEGVRQFSGARSAQEDALASR